MTYLESKNIFTVCEDKLTEKLINLTRVSELKTNEEREVEASVIMSNKLGIEIKWSTKTDTLLIFSKDRMTSIENVDLEELKLLSDKIK